MHVITLAVLLTSVLGILSISLFPSGRGGQKGHIAISANMRPLKNKEEYEAYLRNNAPKFRKSLPRSEPKPHVIVATKDKGSFEKLRSKLKDLQSEHGNNHKTNEQRIPTGDYRKRIRWIRPKKPKQRNKAEKPYANIFETSSSAEFDTHEKASFVKWNQKKFCGHTGVTIKRVSYDNNNAAANKVRPDNFSMVDSVLTDMLNAKRWRPGWPLELLKTRAARQGEHWTTPLSVFNFRDLVV